MVSVVDDIGYQQQRLSYCREQFSTFYEQKNCNCGSLSYIWDEECRNTTKEINGG